MQRKGEMELGFEGSRDNNREEKGRTGHVTAALRGGIKGN